MSHLPAVDTAVVTAADFFEGTRASMTTQNWLQQVNTMERKSAESALTLHSKRTYLKRRHAQRLKDNVFDEDAVQRATEQTTKYVSAVEQRLEPKIKRRRVNNQSFPLQSAPAPLDAEAGVALGEELHASFSELFPPQEPATARTKAKKANGGTVLLREQQQNLDRMLHAKKKKKKKKKDNNINDDPFLMNVTLIVSQHAGRSRADGTLTGMARENIAQQTQAFVSGPPAPGTFEVYTVRFMERWLCAADGTRQERTCQRGQRCKGVQAFAPHVADGDTVPALREFLPFDDRMRFYRTGQLPRTVGACLLCLFEQAIMGWINVAIQQETQDYPLVHCDFENIFDVPGEFLKEFWLTNPPGRFYGLPGPILLITRNFLRPVRRPGSAHLLALKFVDGCLVTHPASAQHQAKEIQNFR